MFALLPDKPDHDALELGVLELWEREETFRRLRELNAGGPLLQLRGRARDREQDGARESTPPGGER